MGCPAYFSISPHGSRAFPTDPRTDSNKLLVPLDYLVAAPLRIQYHAFAASLTRSIPNATSTVFRKWSADPTKCAPGLKSPIYVLLNFTSLLSSISTVSKLELLRPVFAMPQNTIACLPGYLKESRLQVQRSRAFKQIVAAHQQHKSKLS